MGWQRRRRMKSRVSGSRLLSREWSCLGGTQARCSSQWPATTRGDPVWRRLPHQGMSPGLSLTGEFQLSSNLAAGVERAKEAERREREEDERKAREERESPEPKIICETKNFHVRETARDFDFSDTEDNSLSSQQSSLARGGEGSPDAVRHQQPREASNVTRAGGE